MVCDCDGEDTWWDFDSDAVEECEHACDEQDDFDDPDWCADDEPVRSDQ